MPLSESTALALRKTGLTDDEVRAFGLTVDCANAILALPVLHPMDREENCHAIHVVQEKLMARPAMRSMQRSHRDPTEDTDEDRE